VNAPARLAQVAPARAADTPYAMDGWWTLVYQGWTLLTPHGIRIGLTGLERTCLLCLAANPARNCGAMNSWPCAGAPRCAR